MDRGTKCLDLYSIFRLFHAVYFKPCRVSQLEYLEKQQINLPTITMEE